MFHLRSLQTNEGEIKNGQPKDTGNIGHKTQNEDKRKTQKTKNMSNTNPTKNRDGVRCCL
jgi:hypothetical protein